MDLDADLPLFFVDFGEPVTVAGVAARGIFGLATDLELGGMLMQAPTLDLPADVAAADGDLCTIRSATYTVRQVIDLPPDGALRRLVLATGAP